jgi:molybdate transport system ATP-binding protein
MLKIAVKKALPGFNLDVNLSADNGILAILGPSGSGKTMTLQSVAGLIKPDEGCVELNGRVLYDSENKINLPVQKRKVGFVFQHYALFPHLTVRDNIAYGLKDKSRQEILAKVDQLLHTMNIDGLENRYPRQLSAGQQQRVAIARALAPDPDVLLLDEPFSALDPLLKERLELELLDLQKVFGGSILFVTHDLNEGYKLGAMVAVYHSGCVIQHDTRQAVFSKPANRDVARMTGMRNLIEGVVSGIDGTVVNINIPSWGADLKVITGDSADLFVNQEITLGIRPEYIDVKSCSGENILESKIIHKMEGIASSNYRFHINSDTSEKRYLEAIISKSRTDCISEDGTCSLYLPPELLVIMKE